MRIPEPAPGLVIAYGYLWADEARRGAEEGRKDRPCVIVVSTETLAGEIYVTVAPVTHAQPRTSGAAIEIPPATKDRLGLDTQRSWIVADDLNKFLWPGSDLRPVRRDSDDCVYGLAPRGLHAALKQLILELARSGRLKLTPRSH